MSDSHFAPSSQDYRSELARTIAQWLPHDQFLPPGTPSGYVAILVHRFHEEGLDFVVRDPTGGEEGWTVTWRALLAYGALKQSEN